VVLVDQYPILFTAPVWKNVEYGLKVRGVPAKERRHRVVEALELVGMQRFLKAEAHKLSGGETKRVALARALAVRPEVLLCDEPGANVDKENQEIILDILKAINKTEKTSIIFSTHYLAQGRRLADHTLMLEHGMLSDTTNENIYRTIVTDRQGEQAACQLSGRVMLSLPGRCVPPDITCFKLHIDPDRVVYCPKDDTDVQGVSLTGHVVQVNQDRGRVLIGLELGIKLYFFLPLAEYLKNPPVIGGKVTVVLPEEALRWTPL
jgi:tungstate transport system ATP-binding protein